MIKKIILLLILTRGITLYSKTIYVSKDGDDKNNGEMITPLLTIQKALDMLFAGDTCLIRGGVYYETLQLTNSGTETKPICIYNFNNEKVEIHNTSLIKSWSTDGSNIYKTKIKDSVVQFFINNKPFMQASFPSIVEGEMSTNSWADAIAYSNKKITISGLSQFNNLNDAKVFGLHGDKIVGLNGTLIAQSGETVTLQNDAWYWNDAFSKSYLGSGKAFVIGNKQFLDTQGEWYQDTTFLYFIPLSQSNNTEDKIEIRLNIVGLNLEATKNIIISGITFFGGSINMKNSENIKITNCEILYVTPLFNYRQGFEKFSPNGMNGYEDPVNWNGNGPDWNKYDGPETWNGNGIEISGENNTIENCYIAHSWGDGLTVWGKSNKILNNIISDCNWIGIDCAALNISGSNHLIQNNELSYTGRSVLLHRFLENSKIINNHIHHGGILNNDQGLTYSFWTDGKGTEIAYNYLHDNLGTASQAGIYLDNWTYNFNIHHNIINNAGTGININKPHNNHLLYNNTLYNNTYSMGAWGPDGTTIRNVKTFNNLTNTNKKAKWNYDAFYGTSMDSNYVYFDNNIFVDPLNHNFQLRKNSYPIDRGIKNEYTTNYEGSSPDIGAIESGVPPWKYGSSLIIANEKYYPPKAPLQLELLANTFDTTLLRWNYPFQLIDSFYIERKSATETNYSIIARIAASDTTYNDANQPPGEYRYQVRAVNQYGISEPSNSIQIFNPITNNSLYFDAEESDLQEGTNRMGDVLINTDNKDWICFKGIDLANTMYDACMVNMAVPCEYAWQEIQVRLDHPMGRMIGKFRPPSTGGWDKYTMYSFPIEEMKGTHDIYFRFKGEYGIGTMDWFTFYDSNGEVKENIPYDSVCPFPSLKNREVKMRVFPNPVYNEINLTLDCQEKSTLDIEVFDTRGIIYYSNTYEDLLPGTVEIHLHDEPKINELLPGVYMVNARIRSKKVDSSSMLKFIKTNE